MDTEEDRIACETGRAPWLDQYGRHKGRGEWDDYSIPSMELDPDMELPLPMPNSVRAEMNGDG